MNREAAAKMWQNILGAIDGVRSGIVASPDRVAGKMIIRVTSLADPISEIERAAMQTAVDGVNTFGTKYTIIVNEHATP